MTVSRRLVLATCLAFSVAMPAFADNPYITDKTMDLTILLPPPPVKGSPADLADMRAVVDAQAHASDARKAQSLVDSDETVYVMFKSVMGDKFDMAKLPLTTTFFGRIGDSEDATLDPAKAKFGRVRPFMANPDVVKPYAKVTKSPSYPSGHTTRVTMMAIMLSAMVPEKQHEIWVRAVDYTDSRVIGGMHYPTDILAGWRTGTAMAAVMLQSAAFRSDMDAVKTEVRAQLGLPAATPN